MEVVKETLQNKLVELAKIEHNKDLTFAQKVKDLLAKETSFPLNVVVSCGSQKASGWVRREQGAVREIGLRVGILHQKDSTYAFGCEYDLTVYDNQIAISTGTMGITTRKENPEYVEKQIMVGKTWGLEKEIVDLFNETVDLSHSQEILELEIAIHQIEADEREKRENELKARFNELLANNKFVVYLNESNEPLMAYEVEKITDKLVQANEMWFVKNWEDDTYELRNHQITRKIKKQDMFSRFWWDNERGTKTIEFLKDKEALDNFVVETNKKVSK